MGQTQPLPLLEPPEEQPSLQTGLTAERRGFHFALQPNQRLVPEVSHLSPMSNMTYFAEGRRRGPGDQAKSSLKSRPENPTSTQTPGTARTCCAPSCSSSSLRNC